MQEEVENRTVNLAISTTKLSGRMLLRVDYALRKDVTQVPPRYMVFFKAKDADVLTAAFKEYSSQLKHRETRPSVRKMLEALKDIVKDLPGKVREKKQERER